MIVYPNLLTHAGRMARPRGVPMDRFARHQTLVDALLEQCLDADLKYAVPDCSYHLSPDGTFCFLSVPLEVKHAELRKHRPGFVFSWGVRTPRRGETALKGHVGLRGPQDPSSSPVSAPVYLTGTGPHVLYQTPDRGDDPHYDPDLLAERVVADAKHLLYGVAVKRVRRMRMSKVSTMEAVGLLLDLAGTDPRADACPRPVRMAKLIAEVHAAGSQLDNLFDFAGLYGRAVWERETPNRQLACLRAMGNFLFDRFVFVGAIEREKVA